VKKLAPYKIDFQCALGESRVNGSANIKTVPHLFFLWYHKLQEYLAHIMMCLISNCKAQYYGYCSCCFGGSGVPVGLWWRDVLRSAVFRFPFM
jgi:hypothetical protein